MRTKNNYITAAILLAVLFLFAFITGGGMSNAYAAVTFVTSYSGVLEDLEKDENFNGSEYVRDESDYSLNVIQIAESTDGELFIYVYQPSSTLIDLRATTVVLSQTIGDSLSPRNYNLLLIDKYNVFYKYKVEGLTVKSDTVRYYELTNILRCYNPDIDGKPAAGQTISEVPNKVAQLWTVETKNDTVTYSVLASEVITVTQKVVGYCYYDDGLDLGWGAMEGLTKAYFVAFDTDRPIDKLISADLIFFATRVKCKYCGNTAAHDHGTFYDFGEGEYIDFGTGVYNDKPLTITHTDKFNNQGGGNWAGRPANKYTWNRIRTTKNFIADNNNKNHQLTAGSESELLNTKWVLNFYEVQDKYKLNNVWLSFIPGVNLINGVADGEAELNSVFEVQILRLEFETNGNPYNLGVIDNKQTGNEQYNEIKGNGGGCNCLSILPWWAWLLFVLLFPLIVWIVFKFIKWLIKLPFKKLKERRKKAKERKNNAQNDQPRQGRKSKKRGTK